jgi:ATP-dependent exoDNAse (exonuclease V) beta subunit
LLHDFSTLVEGWADRTILDLLSDPSRVHSLSPDGRVRAVRLQRILAAAVEQVGRMPLRQLLRQTWYALGGPSILAQPNQREDIETFLALIGELEQGGIIPDFGVLAERCANLYAKPDTAEDCVRVMTIHEAKGLEFDTVILPHLHGTPPRDEEELLVWNRTVEGELEVAAKPQRGLDDLEYERICDLRKQRRENESKRLFYVACTRAKNQLFLLGSAKTKQKGTEISDANRLSFLHLIWSSVKPQFVNLLRTQASEPQQRSLLEGLGPIRTIARLSARWSPPAFAPSIQWTREFQPATPSERPVTYEWVGGVSRHVGTVVHGFLHQVAAEGLAAWTESRLARFNNTISAELSRLGVDASALPDATRQASHAIRNTLASERGQWILRAWTEAYSEWPIGGRLNGKLISGTIDRLFRDEQARLWIIDYKTSSHTGGQLEAFLANEQRRYREQMETYARLLQNLHPGPISLGLYFPLLDAWREWELGEAVAMDNSMSE